ncbi:TIGR02757 family protein [Hydrogenimonas sp.]
MRERLEAEAARRDDPAELAEGRPDPLMVAREQRDERAMLLCALFGYGSAKNIVAFLRRLDFSLLEAPEAALRKGLAGRRYRFQNSEDVVQAFVTLGRLEAGEMKALFLEGYRKEGRVLEGVGAILTRLGELNGYESRGYRFLFGAPPKGPFPASAYKRWMMLLRWMVRRDALDMGRWPEVARKDLVIPLDTHTFHVGRRLGLLRRKSCDWKAALELTEALKRFDPEDPVRFDFALYRLGQENLQI